MNDTVMAELHRPNSTRVFELSSECGMLRGGNPAEMLMFSADKPDPNDNNSTIDMPRLSLLNLRTQRAPEENRIWIVVVGLEFSRTGDPRSWRTFAESTDFGWVTDTPRE